MITIRSNEFYQQDGSAHLAECVAFLLCSVQVSNWKVKEAFVQPRLTSRTSPH